MTNWGRAVLVTSAPHMAGSGHFEGIWLGGGGLVWRVLDVFTHSRCLVRIPGRRGAFLLSQSLFMWTAPPPHPPPPASMAVGGSQR